MAKREQRRALLRSVNERIAEIASPTLWDGPEAALDFCCECGRAGCTARFCATAREFERARTLGVIVVPEHAREAPARSRRFAVEQHSMV